MSLLQKRAYYTIIFGIYKRLVKKETSLSRCAKRTFLQNGAEHAGGGSRIRTGDFLLAKQALYQLSYAP